MIYTFRWTMDGTEGRDQRKTVEHHMMCYRFACTRELVAISTWTQKKRQRVVLPKSRPALNKEDKGFQKIWLWDLAYERPTPIDANKPRFANAFTSTPQEKAGQRQADWLGLVKCGFEIVTSIRNPWAGWDSLKWDDPSVVVSLRKERRT